jgi:hypothetical protein
MYTNTHKTMECVPRKGVFTEILRADYKKKMDEKKATCDKIMAEIFDPSKTFANVKQRVEKYMSDENNLKNKIYEFHANVDLGPLFEAGNERKLWLHNDKGDLLDFSLRREQIRDKPYEVLRMYECFFKDSALVKKWITELESWFEGCTIGEPHCRWHESSGNPELWVHIQAKNLYTKESSKTELK